MTILITGGRVIDPASKIDQYADIIIKNGKIEDIVDPGNNKDITAPGKNEAIVDPGKKKNADQLQINAEGFVIAPGFIDTHSHFRDPGFTHKEDIFSGAKAAARGGYTEVVLMANTKPAVDNEKTLKEILEKGSKTGLKIHSAANVTKAMKGFEINDLKELKKAGAIVFTDDGKPIISDETIEEAMKEAVEAEAILSFHEELPDFVEEPGINHGKASEAFGIKGADRKAEEVMIARDAMMALTSGAEIIIQHISSKEGVDIVRRASEMGAKIHAEATPHHFALTEEDLIKAKGTGRETMFKMNPPLRTEEDRMAIIEGLKDGTIEMIATDHAPHSEEEKAVPLTKAPSGITGLETAFALGITELVKPGHITLSELIKLMSTNPAKIYGFESGTIEKGRDADLVIFDPKENWVVKEEEFASKSKSSPWVGSQLTGKVKYTISRGKVVYGPQQ